MVTGASTAHLAIVLVDARQGVVEQSRRHALIASLLRIPQLVFAINKMDLVDWSEARFRKIEASSASFADAARRSTTSRSSRSARSPARTSSIARRDAWYHGPTLLEHLETVPSRRSRPARRAVPGAVGDPPAVRRAPRLSRLRRSGRRRRAAPGRRGRSCCRRAARRRSRRSKRAASRSTPRSHR